MVFNVGKFKHNLPFGDGLKHPVMVILGIVYFWAYHINRIGIGFIDTF